MNKENLDKRLKDLNDLRVQKLAEVNAVEGAIQDCLYWISEIDKTQENSDG